jgi:hypothetical protein
MPGASIAKAPDFRWLLRSLGGRDTHGMGSGFTSMHARGESCSRAEPQAKTAVELETLMGLTGGSKSSTKIFVDKYEMLRIT